jgi:hypothetical protein
MEANGVQGLQVGGREPKALLMSDGTRLALEDDGPRGRADWTLLGGAGGEDRDLTVADAVRVAGDQHADYVRIRTRSEVAWLRVVSEWFEQEAARLDRELQTASPSTAATKTAAGSTTAA